MRMLITTNDHVDDRCTPAHRIRRCGERANSDTRHLRAACANAKRHPTRAAGRLSRLGPVLSARNDPSVRTVPLLVRTLLLIPGGTPPGLR